MSFVERYIILCPYLRGSTIGGSTVCTVHGIDQPSLVASSSGFSSLITGDEAKINLPIVLGENPRL